MLTERWFELIPHDGQYSYWRSPARFNCVSAGRRSGKSERAKRKLIRKAISFTSANNGRFCYMAPTRDQVKRIAWQDLKDLSPKHLVKSLSESELRINYINGAHIQCVGMDKPERVEGDPIDGCIVDEIADMKPTAWGQSIRPALSTLNREGWCDFVGKPRGRNHWYVMCQAAKHNLDWAHFTWPSSSLLAETEIEAAKKELDEMTFNQEYEASFLNFSGRAYYSFDIVTHVEDTDYDPSLDLIICFDFNVEPGIAVIAQEKNGQTHCIGEVYIPRNSNTPAVCRKIMSDWGHHSKTVRCYGDATGGARGTAKIGGTDWDLIRQNLTFENCYIDVPRANPPERVRINALNTRLKTASGDINLKVSPKCSNLIEDLEGVCVLEGGSGELDKRRDPKLTHLTDALGYYVFRKFPMGHSSATYHPL